MKRACVVGVMICAALFAANTFAQAVASPQGQIEVAINAMKRAAKVHDVARFMTAYRRSPTLVYVMNGVVIHGWKALRAQQLIWWRGGKSDVVYTDVSPIEFTPLAPGVWVSTRTISSRRTAADGKLSVGRFAVSEIWRKFKDGWRIVYGHESWVTPPSR